MSISTQISKLGGGIGYIYAVDSNGVIAYAQPNSKEGREFIQKLVSISAPLSSNVSASSTVEITSGAGTITNLSYDGVSAFDTGTPVTGASTTDLATNLRDAINAWISVPNYTATSVDNVVTVYADPAEGSSLNGVSSVIAVTGTLVSSVSTLDGGSYPADEIDPQVGFKVYMNASASATATSLTGATDVSSVLVPKYTNSPLTVVTDTIASGAISPEKQGIVSVIQLETEGLAATDDLTTINSGIFADGDVLVIRGVDVARVSTILEGGNIELANNASFDTDGLDACLGLQFFSNTWYEIFRTPGIDLSISTLRAGGIAIPVQGVQVTSLTTGGGTTNLTPGTDKGIQYLYGSGTLTGSWTYGLTGTPIDGDTFTIIYKGAFTASGNTITLLGITLTDTQVLEGNVIVKAVYSSTMAGWTASILRDTNSVDLVDTTDLATKEDALGNPAVDGQVLSSTTTGVRTWVSNASQILFDYDYTTRSSTAGALATATTYTLPAGTLTDGSSVNLEVVGFFAANANAKNVYIKFNGVTYLANAITTAPNSSYFTINFCLYDVANVNARGGGSIIMDNYPNESSYNTSAALDFTANSYDITIEFAGVGAGDVVIYMSKLTKYLA